jgi:hypothetical protein
MEKNMRPFSTATHSGPGGTRLAAWVFCWGSLVTLLALLTGTANSQNPARPYKVTIKDEQEKVVEPILPIDPNVQIKLSSGPNMSWGLQTPDGKRLTFSDGSAQTIFKIDGQVVHPAGNQMPLPPKKGSKTPRHGTMYFYQHKDLHVTQTQEVVPSKLPGPPKAGQKRKMDAVLFKHVFENKGNADVKIAMRVAMDAYNWTTDGPTLGIPDLGQGAGRGLCGGQGSFGLCDQHAESRYQEPRPRGLFHL